MTAGTTRAGRWTGTLLVVPAARPAGKTMIAAEVIRAGVLTWKLPAVR